MTKKEECITTMLKKSFFLLIKNLGLKIVSLPIFTISWQFIMVTKKIIVNRQFTYEKEKLRLCQVDLKKVFKRLHEKIGTTSINLLFPVCKCSSTIIVEILTLSRAY